MKIANQLSDLGEIVWMIQKIIDAQGASQGSNVLFAQYFIL